MVSSLFLQVRADVDSILFNVRSSCASLDNLTDYIDEGREMTSVGFHEI